MCEKTKMAPTKKTGKKNAKTIKKLTFFDKNRPSKAKKKKDAKNKKK